MIPDDSDIKRRPRFYTLVERGSWKIWYAGYVSAVDLRQRSATQVVIDSTPVHSLQFEDGSEWDCINGWRKPIEA